MNEEFDTPEDISFDDTGPEVTDSSFNMDSADIGDADLESSFEDVSGDAVSEIDSLMDDTGEESDLETAAELTDVETEVTETGEVEEAGSDIDALMSETEDSMSEIDDLMDDGADSNTEIQTELDQTPEDHSEVEETAQDRLMAYMSEHKYGRTPKAEYTNDPQWQELNNAFRVEQGLEPIDYGTQDWTDTHLDDVRAELVAVGIPEDSPELEAILQNEQRGIDDIRNQEDASGTWDETAVVDDLEDNPIYISQGDVEQCIENANDPESLRQMKADIASGRVIVSADTEIPTDAEIEQIPDEMATAHDDLNASDTDWERTSLTKEQEALLAEMIADGKIDVVQSIPDMQDPEHAALHLPTEKTGEFMGEPGNSEFIPRSSKALEKMSEYGQSVVEYVNGYPDFSPFTTYESEWGTIYGQVEIPHMTDQRQNPSWEYGRRPSGSSHDPNYDLGNFAQADNELFAQLKDLNPNLTVNDIEAYRKEKGLVWHECADGKTMQLVPAEIHDACRHSGGVSEMKYRMAWGDIERDF